MCEGKRKQDRKNRIRSWFFRSVCENKINTKTLTVTLGMDFTNQMFIYLLSDQKRKHFLLLQTIPTDKTENILKKLKIQSPQCD